MSSIKIHPILSFLFFFILSFLPFASNANKQLFSSSSGNDTVVGYLHIETPNDEPYRVYQVDVYLSLAQPDPCNAMPTTPSLSIPFGETTKVDLVSGTESITEGQLNKADGGHKLPVNACLQIVTYHNNNHTGAISSNKVLIPAGSGAFVANQPFSINLNLH